MPKSGPHRIDECIEEFPLFCFLVRVFSDSHVILRGFRTFSLAPKGAKWHMSRVFEQPRARIPLPKTYSREQRSKTLHITRVFHVPNRKNPHFARGIPKKVGRGRPKGSDIDRPPEGIRTSTHTHTHIHTHTQNTAPNGALTEPQILKMSLKRSGGSES